MYCNYGLRTSLMSTDWIFAAQVVVHTVRLDLRCTPYVLPFSPLSVVLERWYQWYTVCKDTLPVDVNLK
jgi:hypothetical protein